MFRFEFEMRLTKSLYHFSSFRKKKIHFVEGNKEKRNPANDSFS